MIKVIRNAISKDLCAVQAWNMDLLNAAMGYPGDQQWTMLLDTMPLYFLRACCYI